MSQNIVTQRLVNVTNIIFHLMDLQTYALVLPMEGKTSGRNKRKIMRRIVKNNRNDISFTEAKRPKIHMDDGHGYDKLDKDSADDESEHFDPLLEARNKDLSSNEVDSLNNGEGNGSNSKVEYDKNNGSSSKSGPAHAFNDRTVLSDPKMAFMLTEADYALPLNDENSPFYSVNSVIERLDSEDMKGCMIMVASKSESDSYSDYGIVPLAGGIIEIYDEHERSIPAIWVNRAMEERRDINVLLKTLMLRIFAHAYQISLPDRRSTKSNKLVSIYQNHLITFPKECFPFIEKEMLLSKHYEAPSFNEPHNDNPKVVCRCHKVLAQANELFYGISESRFNNLYTNVYEKMLIECIGRMKPVDKMYPVASFTYSEKMEQITKVVRDIERPAKDQSTSRRGRKTTNGQN